LRATVHRGGAPLNRDEQEIAGCGDALALVNRDRKALAVSDATIRQLARRGQ
jgi:hypothetical protein